MASRGGGDAGPAEALADTIVGNYKVGSEIGRGSFAVVFKGRHVTNKSLVALKVVQRLKLSRKLLDNLEGEIQILKKLNHPHIVALIDCKKTEKYIHLIMEFCSVSDLAVIIRKRDRLSAVHPCFEPVVRDYPSPPGGGLHEVLVRHFLQQLSSALEFLRKSNVMHRDVKPQNLLLNPPLEKAQMEEMSSVEGSISLAGLRSLPVLKLADFGFARSLPSSSMAETLCGSPLYMAPEILRFEKYDAKADLWSVGTVAYEMISGRPPFRANNHVDLLRRIEANNDKINFPSAAVASDEIKALIRALLKRSPTERMSFEDLFSHPAVIGPIPGAKEEPVIARSPARPESTARISNEEVRRAGSLGRTPSTRRPSEREDRPERIPREPVSSSPRSRPVIDDAEHLPFAAMSEQPVQHGTPPRLANIQKYNSHSPGPSSPVRPPSRPVMPQYPASAPVREDLIPRRSTPMERNRSQNTNPPPGNLYPVEPRLSEAAKERRLTHHRSKNSRELRSSEEDYVIVDKQQVQVNALADEIASGRRGSTPPTATPGILAYKGSGNGGSSPRAGVGVVTRRDYGAVQTKPSTYTRQYPSTPAGSGKSTLAKALELANLRLFGVSMSPPSPSPPNAQPHGPNNIISLPPPSSSPLPTLTEDDAAALQRIEDCASRSDVVYNFAEVKYAQLLPSSLPTTGLGLNTGDTQESDLDLTPDATIATAEECLVLYVKTLSLLTQATDIANTWWGNINQTGVSSSPGNTSAARIYANTRMNSVVQWIRARFNEVLEKATHTQSKILEAQLLLPPSHPSHPSNHPYSSQNMSSSPSGDIVRRGTGKGDFYLTTGVTADKLMYDRALEMSRASAVNELVGDDLPGCEAAYCTSLRLLEACLERGDEGDEDGICDEDRERIDTMLAHIRNRLTSIRRKMADIKRSSVYTTPAASATPLQQYGSLPYQSSGSPVPGFSPGTMGR